jgi:hypothetical protein
MEQMTIVGIGNRTPHNPNLRIAIEGNHQGGQPRRSNFGVRIEGSHDSPATSHDTLIDRSCKASILVIGNDVCVREVLMCHSHTLVTRGIIDNDKFVVSHDH